MGLDMYLSKRTYVKNWNHTPAADRHKVVVTRGGKASSIRPERVSNIIEDVAYWRKANAIHNWFVQNVQDGNDECQESHVSREQLKKLVELCERALAIPTKEGKARRGRSFYPNGHVITHYETAQVVAEPETAAEILPTASGFFFGSTDYDDSYRQDLEDTVRQLKPLLDEPSEGDFYYRASW